MKRIKYFIVAWLESISLWSEQMMVKNISQTCSVLVQYQSMDEIRWAELPPKPCSLCGLHQSLALGNQLARLHRNDDRRISQSILSMFSHSPRSIYQQLGPGSPSVILVLTTKITLEHHLLAQAQLLRTEAMYRPGPDHYCKIKFLERVIIFYSSSIIPLILNKSLYLNVHKSLQKCFREKIVKYESTQFCF